VFVTDKGYVENKTFLLDPPFKWKKSSRPSSFSTTASPAPRSARSCGKMEAMKPALTDYVVGEELIYDALLEAFAKFATDRLDLYGKEALYNQPEFANDAEKLRQLLGLLDDPEALKKALYECKSSNERRERPYRHEERRFGGYRHRLGRALPSGRSQRLVHGLRAFADGLSESRFDLEVLRECAR
jgi:hypothetical protein